MTWVLTVNWTDDGPVDYVYDVWTELQTGIESIPATSCDGYTVRRV